MPDGGRAPPARTNGAQPWRRPAREAPVWSPRVRVLASSELGAELRGSARLDFDGGGERNEAEFGPRGWGPRPEG